MKLLQLVKLRLQNKKVYISFVYLLFVAILRCPSLVGIPKLGHGNLMSVLEASWVQTLKRLVMFSIFEQKSQKTTTELG